MATESEKAIAVIMLGGPTKGTRFRPLSLQVAKPLIPLAGHPMVHHPIQACKKIPNLSHIFLIGFFEEKDFALYVSSISNEMGVPVRYLREDKSHGSAGGLYFFKDLLLEDNPKYIFVLNCDVCCNFPLPEMLDAHKKYDGIGTLLVKKVAPDVASEYGELVADPDTSELMHYAEKPETFVSDRINCGVYIFSPEVFTLIKEAATSRSQNESLPLSLRRYSSYDSLQSASKLMPENFIRLDQDIFTPFAGKKKFFTFETLDFWEQIKTPGIALRCSQLYLSQNQKENAEAIKKIAPDLKIVGDVFIHPSAKIHPTAKIGPNVSISAHARVGAGARLHDCIILDEVEIRENAVVMHSILGWKSVIGRWARVMGAGDVNAKLGTTILGEDVTVEDEIVVLKCIILPHKSISTSVREEIIL